MTEGVRPCGFLILKLLGQRVPARIGFIVKVNAVDCFRVESSRSFQPAFLRVRQIQFASVPSRLYPGPTQPWVPALSVVLLPQWLGSLDTKTERSGSEGEHHYRDDGRSDEIMGPTDHSFAQGLRPVRRGLRTDDDFMVRLNQKECWKINVWRPKNSRYSNGTCMVAAFYDSNFLRPVRCRGKGRGR